MPRQLADHAPHAQARLDAGQARLDSGPVGRGIRAELGAYRLCVAAPLEAHKAAPRQVPAERVPEGPLPALVGGHDAARRLGDHAVEQPAQSRRVPRAHVGKAAAPRPRTPRRVEPPVGVLDAGYALDELVQAAPLDGQAERCNVHGGLVRAVGRGVQVVRARPPKVPLPQRRAEADQELDAAVDAPGHVGDPAVSLGHVGLVRVGLDRGEQLLVHAAPVGELALDEHGIVGQADPAEALPDDLEGRPLLAHDEHLLARRQGVCDQVHNDLRLARPRRPPHHAQLVGRGPYDDLVLARVAPEDGVEARRAGRVDVDGVRIRCVVRVGLAVRILGLGVALDERADDAGAGVAGQRGVRHLRIVPVYLAVCLRKAADHGVTHHSEGGAVERLDAVGVERAEGRGARLGRRRADVDQVRRPSGDGREQAGRLAGGVGAGRRLGRILDHCVKVLLVPLGQVVPALFAQGREQGPVQDGPLVEQEHVPAGPARLFLVHYPHREQRDGAAHVHARIGRPLEEGVAEVAGVLACLVLDLVQAPLERAQRRADRVGAGALFAPTAVGVGIGVAAAAGGGNGGGGGGGAGSGDTAGRVEQEPDARALVGLAVERGGEVLGCPCHRLGGRSLGELVEADKVQVVLHVGAPEQDGAVPRRHLQEAVLVRL